MKKDKFLKRLVEQAVIAGFKDGKLVSGKVQNFIKSFKTLPRYKAIFALTQYLKGIKMELNKHSLVVESTIPLSVDEEKKIINKMKKNYSLFSYHFSINPALLGGLRIKIGDTVFDNSIETRIKEVKQAIAS